MKKIFSIFFIITLFLLLAVEAKQPSNTQKKKSAVSAKSWAVADENGKIIKSLNANDLRSIASITKLMIFQDDNICVLHSFAPAIIHQICYVNIIQEDMKHA